MNRWWQFVLVILATSVVASWISDMKHDKAIAELIAFQNRGERFTAADGRKLEARISALEEKCD